MEKIKMWIIGDGVISSGFARVLHSITKYLSADEYDIYWLAINYRGDPHDYPFKIFPAYAGGDIYGYNRVADFVGLKPDLIFILNDAWIVDRYLGKIKTAFKDNIPPIIVYLPVDALDHDPDWYKNFDIVTKIFSYTDFGKRVIQEAREDLDVTIMPHGIDNSVFYKLDLPKSEIKKDFYPDKAEFYDNSFIVFNGNRNQPRKKLDVTLQGFGLFAKDKPANVKFYYHGGVIDASIDVGKLAKRYGFTDRLILTSLLPGVQNKSLEFMNKMYNATDVGVNTSIGEGWGLVNVEHGITGAPQVLPAHSACKEIFDDCGILLPVKQLVVQDLIYTTGGLVSPVDLAVALQVLYENKNVFRDLSDKVMTKFLDPKYSWNYISYQWDKVFKEAICK